MAYEGLEGSHAVVLGGAGFLGSHLCTHLRQAGARVTVLDNLITGRPDNLDHLLGDPHFRLVHHDVTEFIHIPGQVDFVINFASPASPIDYLKWPIHTLNVGAMGTHKGLGLALAKNATFFLASTSEVYGDPLVNPQPETYWGNVNPIGPRGVYDEAKRYAEALTLAYHRQHNLAVRIVRIFNTFGNRMRPNDGRAIPAFISAALQNRPLPIHGDGSQTRSLCYVDDLIEGILRLLLTDYNQPVNLGNPEEVTMLELARVVQEVVGTFPGIELHPRPVDDPNVRRPDTTVAEELLGWKAQISLREGIQRTVPWFREVLGIR